MHSNLKDMLHNRGMRRIIGIFLAISFFLLVGGEAKAQSVLGASPVDFVITPEVPAPGQTVTIQARGVGDFLGQSTITWQVGGKTVTSGVGERSFTFTTGGLGVKTTVGVTINSSSEGVITRTFSFNPSFVNLLWEADTTVPPWHKGKALYTAGSTLTVLALPQVVEGGKTVSANNLTFKWSRNGTPITQQSGRGFNQVRISGNQLLLAENVGVEVYSGSTLVAQGAINIPASSAQILLYERDPLRGILYEQALPSTYSLNKDEITLQAQPFYFAKESTRDSSLAYSWTLNNEPITGPDSARGILTLRQTGGGKGSATVSVEIQNTDTTKLLQTAQAAVRMLFGGATTNSFGSFFGL